jgi:predicted DCC family thiol-disulfide oxidoreductase YuxK
MKPILHVASPPAKPLMLYDGDCDFCARWIRRLRRATGERVDYLPYQDPQIATRFPEISRKQFERAVQLIAPEGAVFSAAEAVFQTMIFTRHGRWLLDWYQHWPAFARLAEWNYHFVARHRRLFSAFP